jgi:hypothetical protein
LTSALILFVLATSSACLDRRHDLLVVVQDGKYGFIDHSGKVAIRPQFAWADDFWRGLGTVYVCGHYVSIDSSGSLVSFRVSGQSRLGPRREGEKVGFVDEHGQFKIKPSFDDALPFSEGLAAVRIGEQWGFVDTTGRQVIRPQFAAAYYFHEGVGTATLDSASVLIDRSGKVLASGFEFIDGITSHGRVPATKDGKSGYLDLHGRVVIPLIYDFADTFLGGLAPVKKGGKWGYIDPSGRVVMPFTFDEAGPFASGLAPVKVGARTGFIDGAGSIVFDLPFSHAPGFLTGDEEDGFFIAESDVSRFFTDDEKFGYVNTSGRVIWGPTKGSPDHAPLLGWSDDEKAASCEGISESIKAAIARLFPR